MPRGSWRFALVPHRLRGRLHLPRVDAHDGKACRVQPACGHGDNEPAVRPNSLQDKPGVAQRTTIGAGWLATRFPTTIPSSPSMMQMLISSDETPSPEKYSTAVLQPWRLGSAEPAFDPQPGKVTIEHDRAELWRKLDTFRQPSSPESRARAAECRCLEILYATSYATSAIL